MKRTNRLFLGLGAALAVVAGAGALLWQLSHRGRALASAASPDDKTGAGRAGARALLPMPASADEASGPWTAGERLVYSVGFGTSLGSGQSPAENTTELRGSAALNLSVLAVAPDEIVLRAAIEELSLTARSRQLGEKHVEDSVRDGLGRPFLINVRPNGYIDAVQVDPRTRGMDRSILRAIVAGLSFVGPENAQGWSEWTAEEADQNGVAAVKYVRLAPGKFQKTKTVYKHLELSHHLPLGPKGGTPTVAFEGIVVRGSDGVLETVEGNERLRVPLGNAAFQADTHITLRLLHRGMAAAEGLDAAGLRRSALYDYGPEVAPPAAQLEQRRRDLVAGATFATLAKELEGLPASSANWEARWNVKRRMTALLELDPANLPALRDRLKRSRSKDETEMLLAALSDANTPEAQASLADLARDGEASADLRGSALMHLGLQQHPTTDTVASLSALAEKSDREDLRSAATLALGSAARQARAAGTEGDAPRAAVGQLTGAYARASDPEQRKLYLDALGNAADPAALPAIKEALADPDPVIRGAAANAARSIPGSEAEAVIATALKDADSGVRTRALMALDDRPLTARVAEILDTMLRTESGPGTRAKVVSILGRGLRALPAARAPLEWARDNDPVPSVREAAARALQSPLASGATP
jgi:HEAT repeat protein